MDCSILVDFESFEQYMQLLGNTTNFGVDSMRACQPVICRAIWGTGNPDISGIGMFVGYILEVGLGLGTTLLFVIFRHFESDHWLWRSFKNPLGDGPVMAVFFDSAAYFAAAVELACITSLVKRDYGIDSNGFGAKEARITWAVSVLVALPLMYPIAILAKQPQRSKHRLFLFCLVFLLSLYSIISQAIQNLGPTKIGEGAADGGGTVVTDKDWQNIEAVCFGGDALFSSVENTVLTALQLIAFGFLLMLVLVSILRHWLHRRTPGQDPGEDNRGIQLLPAGNPVLDLVVKVGISLKSRKGVKAFLVLGPTILAVPLLWGVFRMRQVQRALANATGNTYADNEWTFGQIMSVVTFTLVLAEVAYLWYDGLDDRRAEAVMTNETKGIGIFEQKTSPPPRHLTY
ncbi:uncharacterized protein BCR38DRAFT_17683 [Pseudomassariella vexata]|uniref:Uncharacterized protein n=1 Tax=Pseudomassariella vexata TaxID=1141098 RepID=A0A1Y2EK74_9PEZI|nr:uncharacterized protein BCR38DRAFT_17683 [Pseudomassariella vexata]ORY71684.1 hypothetical protein BCR38DRAFT_17683 [Pseudomassariella vexata]